MITELITHILGIAGGAAALWAAVLWLTRKILTHGLNKDLINHTENIRGVTDAQIKRLDYDLKINEYEHQLRFAKVYERQAETIAKLYELISEAEVYLLDSVRGLRWSAEPSQDVQGEKFADFYNKAQQHYRVNRIYIPQDLCVEIDKLFKDMRMNHSIYNLHHPFRDGARAKSDESFKKWEEAQAYIEKEIPLVRAALEERFRQLLKGHPLA